MHFKIEFESLAKKHQLSYQYQEFKNCFGGDWFVCTHSLYNETGCFTIQCVPQRGEVDCYYAKSFSTEREELLGRLINIFDFEKMIWEKNQKIWIFKNPFFYWQNKKVINTIIEVLESLLSKSNNLCEIFIESK